MGSQQLGICSRIEIPESLRLEKLFDIIKPNLCPIPTLFPAQNSSDTCRDGDSKPPWAIPVPDHVFHEKIPVDVQPDPPLAQPEPVPSHPVHF